ncbi:Type 1 glutamine amidotransferase-like domain-containing protein [Altererythrobacter arenosus]|uniref:Type 1 glutamine amidotransferase-like domain-containing protein n=1 Tax=Altererythrobacter arenosus TaxID=3032592 RepID=A0ABY8FRR7_9SPHN|nr:Type 1 glutamine amidotransferase-like domain-containing protein [Altererythrobacter sp. CAU 1644]WFL77709.1 Type 1 glutamine amidotransferase-like domain-containing protein [Altererythrobacter sp. CAU 1644]
MAEARSRQFIALSDSASLFVPSWRPTHLLDYILDSSAQPNPIVRYVGAAKGDQPQRINAFFNLAERAKFRPEVLSFFELQDGNPGSFFSGADIIFIDGGSTRNLLAIFREWGAVPALKDAYEARTVIVGASAGASMMFEWCLTDSIRTAIMPWEGIGLIPGTICVHHNARQERRQALSSFLSSGGARFPAYALDDGVGLHFEDGRLKRGVSAVPDARCAVIEERRGIPYYVELLALYNA